MEKYDKLTLTEIANRIHEYLKRFEGDETINAPYGNGMKTTPYYQPQVTVSGRRILISYVNYLNSYQYLTRKQAIGYLYQLDSGHVGKHYSEQPKIERMV